jgi:ribosomal protein S18 acetylase RimI-like enzyme
MVVELWDRCGLTRPWNDPRKDIRRKLSAQADLFFVGLVEEKVVGTVMAGYEGHRGWINYLSVSPELRKGGLGRLLMQHAERTLIGLGCPKINLQIRSSNAGATAFYRRLGYIEDDVVSFGKRLEHDDSGAP